MHPQPNQPNPNQHHNQPRWHPPDRPLVARPSLPNGAPASPSRPTTPRRPRRRPSSSRRHPQPPLPPPSPPPSRPTSRLPFPPPRPPPPPTTHQTDLLSPSVASGAFAPCDPPTGRACVECWRAAFKAGGVFSSSCQSRTTRWSGFLWPQEAPVARAWLWAATLTLAECEAQELVSTFPL